VPSKSETEYGTACVEDGLSAGSGESTMEPFARDIRRDEPRLLRVEI